MKTETLLSWISLVIGIPSFLIFFVTGQVLIGILVLAIVFLVILYDWDSRKPMVTQLEVTKVLKFTDSTSKLAKLEQNIKAKANHKGVTEFWTGNIASDGSVDNVAINGFPPELNEIKCNDRRIGTRFQPPKNRGELFHIYITLDAHDSFPALREGLIHIVDHETKKLKIEVHFDQDRPAYEAMAELRLGAEIYQLQQPKLTDSTPRKLIFEVDNPKLSGSYFIEWKWNKT